MTDQPDLRPPSDVCLLLRAHAEQRWLSREVLPVLRELERGCLQDEQLSAALAYLEVLWIEACQRAAETEAACVQLDAADATDGDRYLPGEARGYHASVCTLRDTIAHRVTRLGATDDAFARDRARF